MKIEFNYCRFISLTNYVSLKVVFMFLLHSLLNKLKMALIESLIKHTDTPFIIHAKIIALISLVKIK